MKCGWLIESKETDDSLDSPSPPGRIVTETNGSAAGLESPTIIVVWIYLYTFNWGWWRLTEEPKQ